MTGPTGPPSWLPPSPHDLLMSIERRLGWLQGGQEATREEMLRRLDRQDEALERIDGRLTVVETQRAPQPDVASARSDSLLSRVTALVVALRGLLLAIAPLRELILIAIVFAMGVKGVISGPDLAVAIRELVGASSSSPAP